jgi:hypothetical protein
VRDVHDADIGNDAENHGFADGDGVVGDAEIGHENYRGARVGVLGRILILMGSLGVAGKGRDKEQEKGD